MKDIKALLSDLKGVIAIKQIENKDRNKIIELENNYEKAGAIGLKNPGIRMVLKCDTVFALLKDSSFRQPPGPTVFMVEDLETNNKKTDHLLKINNKRYNIIGEELINKEPPKDEKYIPISNDFIIYPERRKGNEKKPAFFLIPPIDFPELEAVKEEYKLLNILSISPSSMADDFIRQQYKFSKNNALATILIGFNKA